HLPLEKNYGCKDCNVSGTENLTYGIPFVDCPENLPFVAEYNIKHPSNYEDWHTESNVIAEAEKRSASFDCVASIGKLGVVVLETYLNPLSGLKKFAELAMSSSKFRIGACFFSNKNED